MMKYLMFMNAKFRLFKRSVLKIGVKRGGLPKLFDARSDWAMRNLDHDRLLWIIRVARRPWVKDKKALMGSVGAYVRKLPLKSLRTFVRLGLETLDGSNRNIFLFNLKLLFEN